MVDTVGLSDTKRALLELRQARKRLSPVPREGRLPLSHQQEGLWFLDRLNPGATVYTIPVSWRLRGPLDVERLERALGELVVRHEALRTRFPSHEGRPCQVIDPPGFAWSDGPFDLQAGPVFRANLTRVGDDEHVLSLAVHHITADGWSIAILTRELAELYAGKDLPPLTLQPVDVAAWQRKQPLDTDYWRNRLDALPVLDFPADRARPAVRSGAGATLEAPFPRPLTASDVDELARAERASPFEVLLAGFFALLARYTGQDDLVIGSVFSGRTRSELEPLVGYFADPLVLRVDASGDPSFRELVARCSETMRGAVANHVPFGVVVDTLKPSRDPSRNPLFQVSFSHVAADAAAAPHFAGVEVEAIFFSGTQSRFDLSATVVERADGRLGMLLEYSTELFEKARMQGLLDHLGMMLEQALADPSLRLSQLRLLTPEQEHFLIHDLNPTPTPVPEALLGDLIESHDGIAIRHGTTQLSYRELNERANQLAHHLQREWHVQPDDIIGILLDRGPELIIAQLAVTRSGAAWLPLDPDHPPQRIDYLLADAKARTVITHETMTATLNTPTTRPTVHTRPDNLAYVIYTSGSTGQPKGVLVTHRNVVDFTLSARELFRVTADDVVLQFANPAFDVSMFDIYTTLAAGATVLTAPRQALHDPARLMELLGQVTVAHLPPAMLSTLDASVELPRLRLLVVGGEAYPASLAERWVRPWREFHNSYGPTETTIDCTDHLFVPGSDSVPLGRAMANHRAYILDASFRPVPVGIPGELYIAGTGLARGYLNQPDLTADRFVPDPFHAGQRMYKTGDLARWRTDHTIEFLGRTDRQLKLNGIRIEPAEIEHALMSYPAVVQAHITAYQGQLTAYITTNGPVELSGLRAHLLNHLPTHLVPTTFTTLDRLPTNANGKVDTKRLPAPSTVAGLPPTSPTQVALAGLWQELLGTAVESTTDNFFTLGGNSLRALQLLTRVQTTLHTQLTLRELFLNPTLAELAAVVDASSRGDEREALEAEIAELSEEELDRLLAAEGEAP